MKYAVFAGLLALAGVDAGSSSHIEDVVVENLQRVPQGWKAVGVPAQDRKLQFRIAMHNPDHALFDQTLMEISTPSHPRYGQHLKRHELKQLIKPREESTNAVLSWLEDSGIPPEDIVNDGEWINFMATVATAEELLDTTFKSYQSINRPDVKKIRTLHYSVPKAVREHIDLIQPTTRFAQLKPQSNNIHDQQEVPFTVSAVNTTCTGQITPACLKDLYNFADYKPGNASVIMGVTGYLEQYARYDDWTQFANQFAPSAAGSNFSWTSVNDTVTVEEAQRSTDSSTEANLDVQYTLGLVGPAVHVDFLSTPGRGILVPDLDQPTQEDNANEPYLDLFTYLINQPDDKLPQVLTTSYGEDEQSVPPEYNKKVCDLIGQLGTRGVSVIFSSGDTGVGSACQTNDGKNTTRFLPIFPAACPYVTSVGGTTGINDDEAVYFSSGGFSDLYETPSYQKSAVSAYLQKLGDRWDGLYNPQGRGFPDVAAAGTRFRVVDKGVVTSVGGTSASAPTFASVIALLNNARLSGGKPALGFLNPWLYQSASGFKDITLGGSTGCTGRSIYSGLPAPYVPYASWNATAGWDPVTGLGTPDFGKLLKLTQGGGYGTGRRGLDGRV